MPAMYRIDGSDLCKPCLLAEGYEIANAELIAPKEMAAAAGAGVTSVTVHAEDTAKFLSNGGYAVIKAAAAHVRKRPPAKSMKGPLAETREEAAGLPPTAEAESSWEKFKVRKAVKRVSAAVADETIQEEETMDKRKCGKDGCDTLIGAANKSGYCQKHFYLSKKATAKKGDSHPGRVCSNSGCDRTLRADNKTGTCTPCQKGKSRAGGGQRQPKLQRKAATRAAKSNGHAREEMPSSPLIKVNMAVTEEWLDLAWSRFTPEQKAEAVATVLSE